MSAGLPHNEVVNWMIRAACAGRTKSSDGGFMKNDTGDILSHLAAIGLWLNPFESHDINRRIVKIYR